MLLKFAIAGLVLSLAANCALLWWGINSSIGTDHCRSEAAIAKQRNVETLMLIMSMRPQFGRTAITGILSAFEREGKVVKVKGSEIQIADLLLTYDQAGRLLSARYVE